MKGKAGIAIIRVCTSNNYKEDVSQSPTLPALKRELNSYDKFHFDAKTVPSSCSFIGVALDDQWIEDAIESKDLRVDGQSSSAFNRSKITI
jgi:hypothetical protein